MECHQAAQLTGPEIRTCYDAEDSFFPVISRLRAKAVLATKATESAYELPVRVSVGRAGVGSAFTSYVSSMKFCANGGVMWATKNIGPLLSLLPLTGALESFP